ncbi:MAG: hypothetical protein JW804_09080 [Sedimentisphaerales bacterium]|nr:hypothetical protein [Sedimentisphaerales bacterium]
MELKKHKSVKFVVTGLILLFIFTGCTDEQKISHEPVVTETVGAQEAPIEQPAAEPEIVEPVVEEAKEIKSLIPAEAKKDEITANYLLPTAEEQTSWLGAEYYVKNWLVLGPYEYDGDKYGGEWACQDAVDIAFIEDEAKLTPKEGAEIEGKNWQRVEADDSSVDVDSVYGYIDYAAAYLGAYVYSPTDMKNCTLYLGSDDYVKVYVNEELVHTYKQERRGAEPDSDKVPGITLKQGWNKVVVKLVDVVQGWQLYVRFADPDGKPLKVVSE